MATLHAYSSDPRALLVLADFASAAPKTAAVRLRSTGAPHRSKGAFHTHQWAFSQQAVGRVDVDHVQLVIRSSHRRLLRSCPGAVLRFLRVVPRSETRVRGRSAAPTRAPEPQHARVGLRVETDPCSAPQSASPAPTLELAHRHGADGHSGTYLWRLEGLTAVGHVGGRERIVSDVVGSTYLSQHSVTYLWRLLEVHLVESAERSKRVAGPKMCPPVEGVAGGAFCALKPITSSEGFCAASPWQTSERERQLGHLRRRHGRALRLALGTVGCAPLCPVARAPDPDPRSRAALRSSLVHASRP